MNRLRLQLIYAIIRKLLQAKAVIWRNIKPKNIFFFKEPN